MVSTEFHSAHDCVAQQRMRDLGVVGMIQQILKIKVARSG